MSNEDRSLSEIVDGEIVEGQGGPQTWLVRFGEGEYELVNKTPLRRLAIETDLLEQADSQNGLRRTTSDGQVVVFKADLDRESFKLSLAGDQIPLTQEQSNEVMRRIYDEDWDSLADYHQEIRSSRVRRGVISQFMPRFNGDSDRVEQIDEGWLVDDAFVVTWEGENFIAEGIPTHVVRGGEAVRADTEKQARVLNFDLPEEIDATTPQGQTYNLSEREVRFLATVEVLLQPTEYLNEREAEQIEAVVEWTDDPISAAARTARVEEFTDEKTGLHHEHGLYKHQLSDLGVTDEAIARLHYNEYDHAGVHEMALRRDEFEQAPFDVFENAPNNDPSKWAKIENTREKAPIPPRIRREMEQAFA